MPAYARAAARSPRPPRHVLMLLLAVIGAIAVPLGRQATGAGPEVRALWVLRTSLTSPRAITAAVRTARSNGFTTLLVQVRGRGDAYFNGGIEPRAASLAAQPPGFDPLDALLTTAHAQRLRVHAWVNVNLVSSASELPSARSHVIYRHPEWLMVPRAIAGDMARIEPQSPAYLGTLARWTRANRQEVEGLYLSPLAPDAATYTASVVDDLVARYPVDGIHLDYARYPSATFDYSRTAMAIMRAEVVPRLAAAERLRLDARARVRVTTYADRFPERWTALRRSRLTALIMRLRTVVKARRPEVVMSAAVFPDEAQAAAERLQDWRTWLDSGLLDVVCPMAYTENAATFARQIASARRLAGSRGVWAGIGAYRLTAAQAIEQIAEARRAHADGIVLYSYDSLTDPAEHRVDYLTEVAQAAFRRSQPTPAGAR